MDQPAGYLCFMPLAAPMCISLTSLEWLWMQIWVAALMMTWGVTWPRSDYRGYEHTMTGTALLAGGRLVSKSHMADTAAG